MSQLACMLTNGDYDGDQAAIHLPLTEAAQREAGEKLSVRGHLLRDPEMLVRWIAPNREAIWGLAWLSRTPEGQAEVNRLAEVEVAAPNGFVSGETVTAALRALLLRDGVDAAIAAIERLFSRGMQVMRETGASISPFIGSTLALPKNGDWLGCPPRSGNVDTRACPRFRTVLGTGSGVPRIAEMWTPVPVHFSDGFGNWLGCPPHSGNVDTRACPTFGRLAALPGGSGRAHHRARRLRRPRSRHAGVQREERRARCPATCSPCWWER